MDASYDISEFIANVEFHDLPDEAIDITKRQILDVLATSLGGSRDDSISKLIGILKKWGGTEESTVLVYGCKLPSPSAVLINSTMSNVLDYDDTHERGHLHAGSVVVPTALAVSELGEKVKGKDFITSICAGVEIGCRIGIAVKPARPLFMDGWSYGSLHGYFTGAAVAGKLLGLNAEQIHNALGIAYNQCSGNTQSMKDAASTKKIAYGFAARGGILAAVMAQTGISGAKNIFDTSETGFYNLYHGGCNREALVKDLGKSFEMLDISFKPYPCCRLNHVYIDAVLQLIKNKGLSASDIEEITVSACHDVYHTLCSPIELKRDPRSTMAAQFSLPWVMACCAVRRGVGVREFDMDSIADRELHSFSLKISAVQDPALRDEHDFARIILRTKTATYKTHTSYARGSVQNPMTFAEIEEKFLDCASIARKKIAKSRLKEVIGKIRNLEESKNTAEIMDLLR